MLRMTIIQKGEPMDDLISRQAAIDALEQGFKDTTNGIDKLSPTYGLAKAMTGIYKCYIGKLHPIQPKRGKWIKLDMHRGMADHKCTACEQECYVPTCMGEPMYAFCPNCGAKMEVTE